MSQVFVALLWALFGTLAIAAVLISAFFTPGRTKQGVLNASTRKSRSLIQVIADFLTGFLSWEKPKPPSSTPPPKRQSPPPPKRQRPPASKRSDPQPPPKQETKKEKPVANENGGAAAASGSTGETLDQDVQFLTDAESALQEMQGNAADAAKALEQLQAEADALFAKLASMQESCPASKVGDDAHGRLVDLAEACKNGPEGLHEAQQALTAWEKQLGSVAETTGAARAELEGYQQETADVRRTDENAYATTH